MIKIAIIGGGPAALSFCMQLLQKMQFHHQLYNHIEIMVFEKNSAIGPGIPYRYQEESHILNLPKDIMEPIYGETGKFTRWLTNIENCDHNTNYPPRYLFGKYLEELATQTQLNGFAHGIKINYYTNNEIIDIQKINNDQYQIYTTNTLYMANYVIYSIGHMSSSTYTHFIGNDGYIHNPFDLPNYNINNNEPITIIGTRLTAIDIALKLKRNNHQEKIYMVSRSGLLPTVLSKKIPKYDLKYLSFDYLYSISKAKNQFLSIRTLNELFWKEISEAEGSVCTYEKTFKSYKDISPLDWINQEISQAESGNRPWQQVLFSLYPHTPNIWPLLKYDDQKLFLDQYNSLFLTYLAAFPLENSYKIRELLISNQLEISGGLQNITYQNNQYIVELNKQNTIHTKFLFNATGPGYDPVQTPLLKKSITSGLITKNPLGGIHVDPTTLRVIDSEENLNSRVFAIGELTKGSYFLTTDLGRVTAQANLITNYIICQLNSIFIENKLLDNYRI